jgi:cobalt-zinc-cadmium efflux system membrane fusion protein
MTETERRRNIWMALAALATAVVVYIIVRPPAHVAPPPRDLSTAAEVATLVGPRLLAIAPNSALEQKLDARKAETETVTAPLLTVTASVAAHFMGGTANPKDRWQFQSADVSNAYADWRRAQNDAEFSQKQLDKTRELASAQVAHFTEVYERLKKLVDTGTETPKDLANAKADLVQAELQTKKDVFDAESAVNTALRTRAAAERTLFQAGIDPQDLEDRDDEVAIVVAQVPEAKMSVVREGESVEARFYGIADRTFPGRVARLAPTLSPERRTLRVLFELPDPDHQLKPGMFADVGLGTDPRQAVVIPSDAVIHVGRGDFVFARSAPGPWRIQEVTLSEAQGASVEVQSGLVAGEEVIGAGAILLKPFLVRALEG